MSKLLDKVSEKIKASAQTKLTITDFIKTKQVQ